MRHLADETLVGDMKRFKLRFTCPFCLNFLGDKGCCAHEWPTEDHRASTVGAPDRPEVVFCKEFELR